MILLYFKLLGGINLLLSFQFPFSRLQLSTWGMNILQFVFLFNTERQKSCIIKCEQSRWGNRWNIDFCHLNCIRLLLFIHQQAKRLPLTITEYFRWWRWIKENGTTFVGVQFLVTCRRQTLTGMDKLCVWPLIDRFIDFLFRPCVQQHDLLAPNQQCTKTLSCLALNQLETDLVDSDLGLSNGTLLHSLQYQY